MQRLILTCLFALLVGCTPQLEPRTHSSALSQAHAQQTGLGQSLAQSLKQHAPLSALYPLPNPQEAFAARKRLAQTAERTLDVQYYIWRADMTGLMLLEELREAAERGVRVRLLLDDLGVSGLDTWLSALNSHANIEVRLFNPFYLRRAKALGFVTHFSRANRRMHNKSFTADNQLSIVGGRNVGDEYFGAGDGVLFADLDVLAAGPVVGQTSKDFDAYWASASAYPVEHILPKPTPATLEKLDQLALRIEQKPETAAYRAALKHIPMMTKLDKSRLSLQWAEATLVSDDPAKGLGNAKPEGLIIEQLAQAIGRAERQLDLVSPYFVPTESGVEAFKALVNQGIRVRILTNALEATDVALVHSGYAKHRRALLEAGVELYEMRKSVHSNKPKEKAGLLGSQGSSLHAKTFAIDSQRIFIGSFNFDPRSANLNTELGFLIQDPTLAKDVHRVFDTGLMRHTYQVELHDNRLTWRFYDEGQWGVLDHDPNSHWLKRTALKLAGFLPIDWLL